MSVACEKRYVSRDHYLLIPRNFQYPGDLLQQVYQQQVALECVFTRGISAYGTIRVNNCSFHKRVFVRLTTDQWKTSSIINAYHSMYFSNNNTDSFQFILTALTDKLFELAQKKSTSPPSIVSMAISFAICYCVNGQEFWDNNNFRNYTFNMFKKYTETNLASGQSAITASVILDDALHSQIAEDYHAEHNTSGQPENIYGLRNLGGTCYMNSVLQSLSFTSLLTNYFLSGEFTQNINIIAENAIISKGIVANEFLNLLYLSSCGQYSILTPAPFKQVIGHIKYDYLENSQQDAHEFLLFLLDCLHKDLSRAIYSSKFAEVSDGNNEAEKDWTGRLPNDFTTDNNSIIVDIFYGSYQSITTCLECMYASHKSEPFVCLSLPIPQTNQCTLEDCLNQLNEEEYLTGDSRWFCSQCQCLSNAKKRLEINKLPKILIIQLKRFQMSSTMEWIKNETQVFCPETNLVLQRGSSSSAAQQPLYTLYSVINHDGSLHDGHYTTFCRNLTTKQQQWFECDDERIKYLQSDQFDKNTKAYLLFYIMTQMP